MLVSMSESNCFGPAEPRFVIRLFRPAYGTFAEQVMPYAISDTTAGRVAVQEHKRQTCTPQIVLAHEHLRNWKSYLMMFLPNKEFLLNAGYDLDSALALPNGALEARAPLSTCLYEVRTSKGPGRFSEIKSRSVAHPVGGVT